MPKLGQIPFLAGPYLELADPTPTIDRPEVLAPIASALHTANLNAALGELGDLAALSIVLQTELFAMDAGVGVLDIAAAAVPNGALGAEIRELQNREALSAGVDQVVGELAAVDPANITAPGVTLNLPELTAIVAGLDQGLFLWDGAFPLWPFAFTAG